MMRHPMRSLSDSLSGPLDERDLDAHLSTPDDATVQALESLDGDIMILGAGGKMGPTVARMAQQANARSSRRVIAVSRFRDIAAADALRAIGVHVVYANLSNPRDVATLPDAPNVVWMAGQKFGTTGDPVGTWTHNVVASALAAQRCAGARIVCFSTGNVYGPSAVADGGSREDAALRPDGEYAASCVGRERVFESIARDTGSPLLLYRLFYACDLRYGVVTDIALKVLSGTPVALDAGFVNVIWQGDANRLALRALTITSTPATALNVTGAIVSVREIGERVAGHANVRAQFTGTESEHALLGNISALTRTLPHAALPLDTLCAWAVAWIRADGRLLNKPTKFEVRDGKF